MVMFLLLHFTQHLAECWVHTNPQTGSRLILNFTFRYRWMPARRMGKRLVDRRAARSVKANWLLPEVWLWWMQATPKYPGGRSQALMPLCSEASGEEAGKDRRTLNSPPRHRRGQFFWVRGTVHWGKTFTVSKAASICQQQAVRLHSASASEESGPGQAETVEAIAEQESAKFLCAFGPSQIQAPKKRVLVIGYCWLVDQYDAAVYHWMSSFTSEKGKNWF